VSLYFSFCCRFVPNSIFLRTRRQRATTQQQSTTAKTLLSFVNEKTKKKFLITNKLEAVCSELGWDQAEVEDCGGVTEFMHKHEKAGDSLLVDGDDK
jgi:hypothetical protein